MSVVRKIVIVLGLATTAGCMQSGPGPADARVRPRSAAETTSPRTAVESIASARCEREYACGHVGAGHRYVNHSVCVQEIRTDWSASLSNYDCPGGVNREQLGDCVREIRNEDCMNPFDSLERAVACRHGGICIDHG